jgi:arylsulfatase A-like enzyme
MPRAKRWLYDSGIRVPLIVRWPGKFKAATVNDSLVSFVDFAPTVLSLAGASTPARLQGQVFLGGKARERQYVYAARDRMDETFDRIRAVRDKRFKYIRNYHPELPYTQPISYNELNPTMQAWRRLNDAGQLTGAAKLFFAPVKPQEELYDTLLDPEEINNLASHPKHKRTLTKMRGALGKWITDTKDLGEFAETELIRRGLVRDVLKDYANRQIR